MSVRILAIIDSMRHFGASSLAYFSLASSFSLNIAVFRKINIVHKLTLTSWNSIFVMLHYEESVLPLKNRAGFLLSEILSMRGLRMKG